MFTQIQFIYYIPFLLKLHIIKTMTKQSNIVIKRYYSINKPLKSQLLSKINNLAELKFLFKRCLSRLISKLSVISNTNLLFLFRKNRKCKLIKRRDIIAI